MHDQNIKIACNKCGRCRTVERQWVLQVLSIDPYSSFDSIEFQLNQNREKLVCAKCGAHEARILREGAPVPAAPESADYEKRYVDEGIAGTREDNKKMSSRQSGTNLSYKF